MDDWAVDVRLVSFWGPWSSTSQQNHGSLVTICLRFWEAASILYWWPLYSMPHIGREGFHWPSHMQIRRNSKYQLWCHTFCRLWSAQEPSNTMCQLYSIYSIALMLTVLNSQSLPIWHCLCHLSKCYHSWCLCAQYCLRARSEGLSMSI